jgi:hypothetical protein
LEDPQTDPAESMYLKIIDVVSVDVDYVEYGGCDVDVAEGFWRTSKWTLQNQCV